MCVFECRDDTCDCFFGEVLHGQDFCAGEAGFAEGLFAKLEHFLCRGGAAVRAEGFDASEDGGGGFAGDGLVDDGFLEGLVGAFGEYFVELELLRGLD